MRSYTHVTRQIKPGSPGTVVITTHVRRSPARPLFFLVFMVAIFLLALMAITGIQESADKYNACVYGQTASCEVGQ